MATVSNTFAALVEHWVDRGFRGTPAFVRKRRTDGEFEAFVKAPRGAMAGRLVIVTCQGNLYVRLGPPHTFYPVGTLRELVSVVRHIVSERAVFALTYKDDVWTGTTLINRGDQPSVRRGEVAYVVSWSGRCDRRVETVALTRSKKRVTPAAGARGPANTTDRRGVRPRRPNA